MKDKLSKELLALINDKDAKSQFDEISSENFSNHVPNSDLPFSMWEYHCAFSMVANKENWKEPVSATIHADDKVIVERAIINNTASIPTFTAIGDGMMKVTADGYYIGTGEVTG